MFIRILISKKIRIINNPKPSYSSDGILLNVSGQCYADISLNSRPIQPHYIIKCVAFLFVL